MSKLAATFSVVGGGLKIRSFERTDIFMRGQFIRITNLQSISFSWNVEMLNDEKGEIYK